MTDLRLYTNCGGYEHSLFDGEDGWCCLRLTSNKIDVSGLGEEIWDEVVMGEAVGERKGMEGLINEKPPSCI